MQAKGLTQEALIKIISGLSSFKGESAFRTWAYRIVWNHFLNQKKKPNGPFADNFEDLGTLSDNAPDIDISLEEQEAKKGVLNQEEAVEYTWQNFNNYSEVFVGKGKRFLTEVIQS